MNLNAVDTQTIIEISNLHKRFPLNEGVFGKAKSHVYAVNGVSFELEAGKTVGLVGESGCGKSTIGKMICLLETRSEGELRFDGAPISEFGRKERLAYHRQVQMIFQNPYTSLNPRQRVGNMLKEIYKVHRLCDPVEINGRIDQTLEAVGLSPDVRDRYPFEFSGGQRQRLCIARALTVNPRVVICDEPVSALDVSIQAQILRLLDELQQKRNLAYLFISHDLSVVYHICDEVLVMYMGKIVERGPVQEIFSHPKHPYTKALLSAIPVADPESKREHIILQGDLPSPTIQHPGCAFASRCPAKLDQCTSVLPPTHSFSSGHSADCHALG